MKLRKYRKIIIFLLDLFIILMVISTLFYIIPTKVNLNSKDLKMLLPYFLLFIVCMAVSQLLFKSYDSLWRYAQSKEYLMMLLGGGTGYLAYLLIGHLILKSILPMLFSLAVCSISLLGMFLMRLCYRQYRTRKSKKMIKERIPLAIIGAGEAGVKLLEEIESNPNSNYDVICFIDDSEEKIGKRVHNTIVKGPIINLDKLLNDTPVKEVVVAIPSISAQKRKKILDICSSYTCRVRILPNTLAILQSEEENHLLNSVRDIKIEELLGREQIIFNNEEIRQFLFDKVVMVTGGGGSIGSELCRQIAKANPKCLVIVDIYENNAYDIQQELGQLYKGKLNLKIEIASVRDKSKIFLLFKRHKPNIVFHAAAHKHVPLMEDCPEEAILNNIFGTYNVAKAADHFGVDKFVLISTDKAVNPTNIMGASKRFCEMILQSMKDTSKTEFVAVRFGNVLGSNGSVIPLFQKQILQGGPLTVTDKRIVRYFMTISEAVQLVLQAGAMANSSEVYVLDMGEPIKILDLAENLIRLSGHVPYSEIPIIETGLRPGEKLYEELLQNSEELIATRNHKIYIEHQESISRWELKKDLIILQKALETKSLLKIKNALKKVVTTYKDPEEVNKIN